MSYINCLATLLRNTITKKTTWIIFPFAVVAVVLSAVYFIYSAVYMLIDLLTVEMRKELETGNDKVGLLAMAYKYLIAYSVYISFQLARIFMLIPMAVFYFIIDMCLFVSSIGKVKEDPFIFHSL